MIKIVGTCIFCGGTFAIKFLKEKLWKHHTDDKEPIKAYACIKCSEQLEKPEGIKDRNWAKGVRA